MINKWRRWDFWKSVRDYSERKMTAAWMSGGNCDSACARCKQWESKGNRISTSSRNDGSEVRSCFNCGHRWLAMFTPAGFIVVETLSDFDASKPNTWGQP